MTPEPWLKPVFGESLHRDSRPRRTGLTVTTDRGLGSNQFEDLLQTAGFVIDHLKFPFGTSAFQEQSLLQQKIRACQKRDILVYPGGTLFEMAYARGKYRRFLKCLERVGFPALEISSGTIDLPPNARDEAIRHAHEREFVVVTEVGKKDPERQPDPRDMARQIRWDFESGARNVIIEARESGRGIGIYDEQGEVCEERVDELIEPVDQPDRLIWEAPLTNQQAYLIQRFGKQVNLGNIPHDEVLALEALRWGLRWETARKESSVQNLAPET